MFNYYYYKISFCFQKVMAAKQGLLILLLLIMFFPTFAQERVVTGKVTDGATQQPMPGVSVLVKGTSTGSTTDANGTYSLKVAENESILVVSFIGYASQEIAVGARTTIDVSLVEDVTSLNEVVVTALGVSRESKELVYATQSIKPSTLTEVRDANNVLNSLQGKIANAIITQGSGGPGSGARIVLRGNRSIQGSNNALIVVDGIPITNNTLRTAGNDFGSVQSSDGASNINPDDIESMTILQGASAAALYGSQAGNGVIVITTKKGQKEKLSVNVNSGVTSETVFAIPTVQNQYGQGSNGILGASEGTSWGAKMSGQSYTNYLGEQRTYSAESDNIKEFFRTGVSVNNSVGISGGSEKTQTYLSYTNNQVKGIVPSNDLIRHNINLRLSNQISKKLSTDAKITYIKQDITNRPRTGEENAPVIDIYNMPRNVSISDAKNAEKPNNVGVPTPTAWPSTNNSIYQNPYWLINRTSINESRDRLIGFVSAKYDITSWLNLKGRMSLDKTIDEIEEKYSQGTILWASQPGGYYSKTKTTLTQRWYDIYLQGNNKITSNLRVNYMAGAIFQDRNFVQDQSYTNGLNIVNKFSLNFATNPTLFSSAEQVQTQSVFGQVGFAFKESIFLEASLRNDWDSRLPSPYTITYPSIGLSGIISDLVTLPSAISFLKANVNYAKVGNGGQAQIRTNTYAYSQGSGNGFLNRGTTEAISGLKAETVTNLEIGVNAKFFDNKFGLSVTVYKSNSENQLLKLSLPVATGYSDKYINAGNIENKGLEVVLSATALKTDKFSWDVAANLGMNRNKIVELSPDIKSATLSGGYGRSATPVVNEGGSYGELLAFRWQKNAAGDYKVNSKGLPISSTAQESIGNFNPQATLGLTNSFTYGNFSARVLMDGRVGGVIVSGTEMNLAFSGIPEVTATNRETGWNLGGVDESGGKVTQNVTAQQFWQTASGQRYGTAEFFAYDATNFRIRELSIGYDFKLSSNLFIKSAKISFVARNLAWLYRGSSLLDIPGIGKRKMWFDPDMSLGNGNYQGVEYGTLPATRSIGVNVNLTF